MPRESDIALVQHERILKAVLPKADRVNFLAIRLTALDEMDGKQDTETYLFAAPYETLAEALANGAYITTCFSKLVVLSFLDAKSKKQPAHAHIMVGQPNATYPEYLVRMSAYRQLQENNVIRSREELYYFLRFRTPPDMPDIYSISYGWHFEGVPIEELATQPFVEASRYVANRPTSR